MVPPTRSSPRPIARRAWALLAAILVVTGLAASAATAGASSTFLVQDTFQRANVSSGWGTATDGNTWTVQGGNGSLDVNADEGQVGHTSSALTLTLGPALSQADTNSLVRLSTSSNGAVLGGILARYQSASSYYELRAAGTATNQLQLLASGRLLASVPFSFSGSTFYWMRFVVQGSTLDGRVWQDGTTEPTTWQISLTDNSITTPGYAGLYGYNGTATARDYDNFSVAPVSSGPTASLVMRPGGAEIGQSVTADASGSTPGSNPIATYTFNFGDGSAALGPQPGDTATHSFAGGGVYTVTVTVTDSAGNTSQASATETVGSPTAKLSVTPLSGNPPLSVTADASGSTDASGVSIANYRFTFGDGSAAVSGSSATATHTYAAVGSYTVTVTVTDSAGVTASTTATVEVVNGPTALLVMKPGVTGVGKSVTADASGSTPGSNPIATYTFNFGDGSAALGPQPGDTATHSYALGGVYTVTVTVTDSVGNASQATATETVGSPTAALSVTPSSGSPPLAVTADASGSTDASGVSISSYSFNFGDGSAAVSGSSATAIHTYTSVGSYTVTVTVTDSAGVTSTATASVALGNPPSATLTVTPSSGTAPLTVTADASGSTPGTNPIASYTFNFGDGTTVGPQTGSTASYQYTLGGSYTVTVTVTDSAGLISSATQTVTVSSAYLRQDTFQRGNVSSGWGTATDGNTWTVQGGNGSLDVNADEGQVGHTSSTLTLTLGPALSQADTNSLVRFSTSSSGAVLAGILARYQSSSSYYLLRAAGASTDQLQLITSGRTLATTGFTFSPNTFYWMRMVVAGSTLQGRVWVDGTAEPSTWQISITDTTISAAGYAGLYAYNGTTTARNYDSFSVAPASPQPPNSTISGTVTNANGIGIGGVIVSTVPASTTATTSASGNYSLPVVSGTYTVVFSASSLGYNDNDAANVTAPANGSVSADQQLAVIPPQVAMDTFTQPDRSSGWGVSTDGHAWSSDISNPPNPGYPINGAGITGNQAWVDASGNTYQDFDTWMGYQYENEEVTADIDVTKVVSDPTYQHGARLLVRVEESGTSPHLGIVMTIDPPNGSNPMPPGSTTPCTNGDISLWVSVPSTWTKLAMVCQTVALNQWYHAKLDVVGNLIEGEVWAFGNTEPGWQIIATQTSPNEITGLGQAGMRTTGSYVYWSNFQQTPITQITGAITNASTGATISGAVVTLTSGSTVLATAYSDALGRYSFSGLPGVLTGGGPTYTISVSASGYTSSSATDMPAAGATDTVNFALT